MEVLRILFALGFLAPGYYAMEIQPSVLPRNLDVYCKFCNGLSAVFDNLSYEDYDFWRTIDVQEKVRFFCSFCKKKTESTTMPTTTESINPSTTTSMSSQPGTSSATPSTPSTPETSSVTPSTPPTSETSSVTPSTPETSSVTPSTPSTSETPSSPTENSSPMP